LTGFYAPVQPNPRQVHSAVPEGLPSNSSIVFRAASNRTRLFLQAGLVYGREALRRPCMRNGPTCSPACSIGAVEVITDDSTMRSRAEFCNFQQHHAP